MTRFPRLMLLVTLVVAALAPLGLARASQQAPVSLNIQAGYDGRGQYHVGHWFPVTIVAANDGGDLNGTLEWRFPGDTSPAFRYEIDLPRGARKQVLLPVVTNSSSRLAELRLIANGTKLLSQNVRLNPISNDEIAVGILSSDLTLLNSLTTVQLVSGYTTALARLDPALLPSDAAQLEGLDVIVIHDLATDTLSDSQRGALEHWVRLGGTLLVGGGADAERTSAGLSGLLPVQVGGLRTDAPLTAIERLAGQSGLAALLQSLTANQVTLQPGAGALDTADLIVEGAHGDGRVIFAAFDLAVLRAWQGEPALWEKVLALDERMQMAYSFRWRSENIVRDTLKLAALSLPSPAVLLLLIVIYIVVVGPVNFLVLRRMRRVDLAWLTTPGLVALFLIAAYGASFALRGINPQVAQLSIVQSFEGARGGQATAFVSVFSPQRRSYTLSFAPDALVSPGTFESLQFTSVPVSQSDSATMVKDLLIDVSALRTMLVEQPVGNIPEVQSQLTRDASRVSGQLRNLSGETLRNAMIVSGAAAQSLGDIGPGTSANVDLARNLQDFPDQASLPTDGLFDQQQVINTLFNYDRFTFGGPTFQGQKGLPDTNAIYLLAWRSQPALDVTIDGDGRLQRGLTLFLIRLNT